MLGYFGVSGPLLTVASLSNAERIWQLGGHTSHIDVVKQGFLKSFVVVVLRNETFGNILGIKYFCTPSSKDKSDFHFVCKLSQVMLFSFFLGGGG